ncbi:MAG TPA: serine/threonine-protein kinase, partial [Naasia sp.]
DIVEVTRQIADGLAHVHSRGIVHRDVKPANVLVARDRGRVVAKLADLGIARLVDGTRMTAVGTIIGTAAYLSPEQVLGESPTPVSDVYSLGLMLLETLTGEPCYPGTRAESLTARTTRPPRIPHGLTPPDEALLRAMTAIDPAERPGAADVAVRLAQWTSDGPFRVAEAVPRAAVTADLDATQAGLAPTRTLPLAGAPDGPGATAEAPAPGATADATGTGPLAVSTTERRVPLLEEARRPRRLRTLLLAGGATLAAVAVATAAFLAQPAPETPAPTPTYPTVDGELGTSLDELQESVQP